MLNDIDRKIAFLACEWLEDKEIETAATARRRETEDKIKALAAIAEDFDSTQTIDAGEYTLKISGRIDRKVDSDLLQEVAAEHGMSNQLPHLFRWKAEINASTWRDASDEIKHALSAAITAKPGRASFKIVFNQPKE